MLADGSDLTNGRSALLRARRLCLSILSALVLMGASAAVAQASSVQNVTVDNSPTDATSAPTVYKTTLNTSSPGGALRAGATITISFAGLTDLSRLTNGGTSPTTRSPATPGGWRLHHVRRHRHVLDLQRASVAASDSVTVELDGVLNPSRPSTGYESSVSTIADTTPRCRPRIRSTRAERVWGGRDQRADDCDVGPDDVFDDVHDLVDGWFVGGGGGKLTINFPSGTDLAS